MFVCGEILDAASLEVRKIQKTWKIKNICIFKKVVLEAVTDLWTPTGKGPSNFKDLQSKMSEIPAETGVNSEQTSHVCLFSLQLEDQITLAQTSVSLKWISSPSPGLHLEPFIPLCPEFFSSPAHQFLSVRVEIPYFLALEAVNFSKPCLPQCWAPTAPVSWGFIMLTNHSLLLVWILWTSWIQKLGV